MLDDPPHRVLLGVTGSFGATFSPAIVLALRSAWASDVRVVISSAAKRFVTPSALAIASHHPVTTPNDAGSTVGRIEHIELMALLGAGLFGALAGNSVHPACRMDTGIPQRRRPHRISSATARQRRDQRVAGGASSSRAAMTCDLP